MEEKKKEKEVEERHVSAWTELLSICVTLRERKTDRSKKKCVAKAIISSNHFCASEEQKVFLAAGVACPLPAE